MNWTKALCVAASVAVLAAAPAKAAILWQQTIDPRPSGLTSVMINPSSSKVQSLYLYVDHGTLNSVDMFIHVEWEWLWWEKWGDDWYLSGNEYFKFIYPEIHPSGKMAQLIYQQMPSFYTCDGQPRIVDAICSQREIRQFLLVNSAVVASRERFTLTLSNERPAVPEPMTWALMVTGFGGIGAVLRRNRHRKVPAL
ncbi:MAG TPA: PEPxxWA-CTERM sorting domain-containing protein [Phenylobacterium sp.]